MHEKVLEKNEKTLEKGGRVVFNGGKWLESGEKWLIVEANGVLRLRERVPDVIRRV